MSKILIIVSLMVGLYSATGEETVTVNKRNWIRLNMTAMYHGYFQGDNKAYLSFFDGKDANSIIVYLFLSKTLNEEETLEAKNRVREYLKSSKINFDCEDWLSYDTVYILK